MVWTSTGRPARGRTFFRGSPFEPPRAMTRPRATTRALRGGGCGPARRSRPPSCQGTVTQRPEALERAQASMTRWIWYPSRRSTTGFARRSMQSKKCASSSTYIWS